MLQTVAPRALDALRARPGLRELITYGAIGGTSAILYIALNALWVGRFGLHPSLAIVITLALLIPPTYIMQRRFTFRSRREHSVAFPRYLATQAFGNIMAIILSAMVPQMLRAYPLQGSIALAAGVAVSNYALLKLWTFKGT